jgi:UDP-hydrolysing UDP-N-acetyl-D-glucosamine 2-epimerase
MNKKRKICIPITTRGNYAKMKSLINLLQDSDDFELQVVAAGGALLPRHGNIAKTLSQLAPITRQIHYLVEGDNLIAMAKSAGLAALEFATVYAELKPDVAIIIADRYECLPMAMAAAYQNIPIAHVEGGEVSGSIDESVRHAITKLAGLHFPSTVDAAERIRRMGEHQDSIFCVGASSLDIINFLDLQDLSFFDSLQRASPGEIIDITKPYVIIIQHPVTTEYEDTNRSIEETQTALHSLDINKIWIWPNMDGGADMVSAAMRRYRENYGDKNTHYFKGLPIEVFAPLLANAACIVGNSSSGIRESSFLGTPSVNIGNRQHNRVRRPNTIDVSNNSDAISHAIRTQIAHGKYPRDMYYGDGNSGKAMYSILKKYSFPRQKVMKY